MAAFPYQKHIGQGRSEYRTHHPRSGGRTHGGYGGSADIVIVSVLAIFGWLLAPVPAYLVGALLLFTLIYTLLLDQIKVPLLHQLTK